jgi:hypothetical protein
VSLAICSDLAPASWIVTSDRYGTSGSGSSNSHGQNLVPPPGQPNILVCQNAGRGLSCRDLNGDLNAPIGAGVYAADPAPAGASPHHRPNPAGFHPGFTSPEPNTKS